MKPRYIRVISDLHLEQYTGQSAESLRLKFIPPDERDAESVLVLAGDISSKLPQLVDFLREVEKFFPRVYYLGGNHEPYGSDLLKWAADFRAAMTPGPFDDPTNPRTAFATLDVGYEELENVRIIWGTLWADGGGSLYDQAMVGRGLRDFFVIRMGDRRFTVPDMMAINKRHKADIKRYLQQPFDGVTVVVTHHLPSYRLCHPRFGTEINGGFASNCDDILASDYAPALHIMGHTHDRIDTTLWKTRIVCNPSGYYFETDRRYNNYQPALFIEIDSLRKGQSDENK